MNKYKKIIENKYKNILEKIRVLLFNTHYKSKNTIITVGSPRSGTTWLMEILDSIEKSLTIFEPLRKKRYPLSEKYGFTPRTYINPEKDSKKHKEYLKYVFEGKIISNYSNFNIRDISKRFLSNILIVKFIRANRIFPWIINNFDLRGSLLIIRHPCATIASQLKFGITGYELPKNVKLNKERVLSGVENIDIIPERIKDQIKDINSREEILTVTWALDQYIPLYFRNKNEFILVVYEKLVLDGKKEVKRIFYNLGFENLPQLAFKKLFLPSKQAKKNFFLNNKNKQVSKWKKLLSNEQIEKILSVLDIFGLNFYNTELEPDYKKLINWSPSH